MTNNKSSNPRQRPRQRSSWSIRNVAASMALLTSWLPIAAAVQPKTWTATQYIFTTTETDSYLLNSSPTTATFATTRTVLPGVTFPSAVPTASTTSVSMIRATVWGVTHTVTVVYLVVPESVVNESDVDPRDGYGYQTATVWSQELHRLPAPSCPPGFRFTFTETASVPIPWQVEDQLRPTAVVTNNVTVTRTGGVDIIARPTAFLPHDALWNDVEIYSGTPKEYDALSCQDPDAPEGSKERMGAYRWFKQRQALCSRFSSRPCSGYRVAFLLIVILLPLLFVLGWIESFFWFRRLMCGQACMRLGTFSWTLMSVMGIFFLRYCPSRTKEDRQVLRAQWRLLGTKTRLKMWFQWGFRHSYPTEFLGDHPGYDYNSYALDGRQRPLVQQQQRRRMAQQVQQQQQQQPPPPPPAYNPAPGEGEVVQAIGADNLELNDLGRANLLPNYNAATSSAAGSVSGSSSTQRNSTVQDGTHDPNLQK